MLSAASRAAAENKKEVLQVYIMSKSTNMRRLRHKYGIYTTELSRIAGVSQQFISDLELGKFANMYDYRRRGEPMLQEAFEIAAADRLEQARRL